MEPLILHYLLEKAGLSRELHDFRGPSQLQSSLPPIERLASSLPVFDTTGVALRQYGEPHVSQQGHDAPFHLQPSMEAFSLGGGSQPHPHPLAFLRDQISIADLPPLCPTRSRRCQPTAIREMLLEAENNSLRAHVTNLYKLMEDAETAWFRSLHDHQDWAWRSAYAEAKETVTLETQISDLEKELGQLKLQERDVFPWMDESLMRMLDDAMDVDRSLPDGGQGYSRLARLRAKKKWLDIEVQKYKWALFRRDEYLEEMIDRHSRSAGTSVSGDDEGEEGRSEIGAVAPKKLMGNGVGLGLQGTVQLHAEDKININGNGSGRAESVPVGSHASARSGGRDITIVGQVGAITAANPSGDQTRLNHDGTGSDRRVDDSVSE